MNKLLTIITSTYNKGDRNRASIQSILDQTYRDFEYIVVNDGSPDHTKEILSEFDDPRLKIIHQQNRGFIQTMISVMNEVETPYVAIQGAGDISLPERLETQIQYLQSRSEVGVVSCTVRHVLTSDTFIPKASEKIAKDEKPEKIEYNTINQMIRTNIVDHGEAMIRMSAYKEAGGYRPFFQYAQDRDLWLRVLENYSIVKLKQFGYIKITDQKFDISGNPEKAEKQALYSLFSRHLAQEKIATGEDLLEKNGKCAFEDFISTMNAANKEEVIRRVFRNTIRSKEGASPESIETAIKIIQKYSINHNFVDSLRAFRFMQNNVPRGGSVYYHYYHIIKTMMERGAAKFLKLTSQFQTTVSS